MAVELGLDVVTHVSQLNPATASQFEFTGVDEGEVVVETRSAGWLYYAIGSRSPHFVGVTVARYEPFLDITGNSHIEGITAVWEVGISSGCGNDYYCPDDFVTRAQMATFIARAVGLDPIEESAFSDVEPGAVHEGSINAIAAARITSGCGENLYCPDDLVSRAQMATFLARALDLVPLDEGPFSDLEGIGVHVGAINAIGAIGISQGCAEGLYCPSQFVRRDQMASFLARAFIWLEDSETSSSE